jgi:hypothetical protein
MELGTDLLTEATDITGSVPIVLACEAVEWFM